MSNKKVLIITYNFGLIKAGPVIRFMRYAPLFAEKGLDVVFLTRKINKEQEGSANPFFNVIYFESEDNVKFTREALKWCNTFHEANIVFFSLEYKNYFDIISARGKGNKLIYVSTMSLNDGKRSLLKEKIRRILLKRIFYLMDAIVSSSEELSEEYKNYGIKEDRIVTISNGVDTSRFSPVTESEKHELKIRLGIDPSKKVLLYVGLFNERKGIVDLFSTWKELNNIECQKLHLCMVGQYKETIENSHDYVKKWLTIENQLKEMENVSILPFSEKVEQYFKVADAFVFMSKLEGMPNVFLEAMASGLPIFTTRFIGFSRMYGDNGKDYIELTRSSYQDSRLIKSIINNQELLKQLGEQSRNRSEKVFSLESSIKSYIKLFE